MLDEPVSLYELQLVDEIRRLKEELAALQARYDDLARFAQNNATTSAPPPIH